MIAQNKSFFAGGWHEGIAPQRGLRAQAVAKKGRGGGQGDWSKMKEKFLINESQSLRDKEIIVSGGKKVNGHDVVPLFFNANNPTLHVKSVADQWRNLAIISIGTTVELKYGSPTEILLLVRASIIKDDKCVFIFLFFLI